MSCKFENKKDKLLYWGSLILRILALTLSMYLYRRFA
jgi:hypothetical protein